MKYAKFTAFTLILLLAGSSAWAAMSDEDFVNLCESGTADKIEAALNDGAFIGAHYDYWSPLMMAANYNPDPKVTELLIEFGADLNEIANDYMRAWYNEMPTPLMMAAHSNPNPEVVEILIQAGANINIQTGYSSRHYSALFWALRRPVAKTENQTKTVSQKNSTKGLILSSGSNSDSENDDDPRTVIIKMLINAKADVNARNYDGSNYYYPLMLAKTFPVAAALIEAGADVNQGKPLCVFISVNAPQNMIELLLDHGADVNINSGEPLELALSNKNAVKIELIQLLLDRGADINLSTPLITALMNEKVTSEVIELLLVHGTNINEKSSDNGYTPLHFAARYSVSSGIVELLLDRGADPKVKDNSGKLAVDYARENRHLTGSTLRRLVKASR